MKSYILEEENKKYLVFEPDTADSIDKVAMGMLENNEIAGLISFTMGGIDDRIIIRYDVTGLVQVSEILGECMKKEKIINILAQILDIYSGVEKYLIEPESIILDYEKIFYKKDDGKLYFIITPVLDRNLGNPELKVFLKNFICQLRFDSTENCDYIGKMLGYLNSDSVFSVEDFRYVLDLQGTKQPVSEPVEEIEAEPVINEDKPKENEIHIPDYTINKPQYEEKKKVSKKVDIASEVIDEPEKDPEQNFKIPMDFYADDEEEENKSKKGLFSMLFKEKEPKSKNKSKKKENDSAEEYSVDFCDKNGDIIPDGPDENATVCIRGNHGKERPSFLLRTKTNERIFIRKNNFKIGTEKKSVDYCITDNTAVSRMHASIVKKNDIYFIVDNHSTNHTYLNDKAIKENSEVKLLNKSRVRLADEEFVFYI